MTYKIVNIGKTYRYINRYREIITVLIKYGFDDFISKLNLRRTFNISKNIFPKGKYSKTVITSRYERIRLAIEELGPSFVKLGQIMSNRPDLLPQELIVELEKLQSSVTPFPEKEAKQLIEQELGKPISELFKEFQNKSIAAASIAQVYKATLNNGDIVAVKVQRPKIKKLIEADLEIMFNLASLAEKHISDMDKINPTGIIKEFEKSIKKEIDFYIEASHIEKFAKNFEGNKTIYVPKVYRDYTTQKVLTMEFIDGINVSDIDSLYKTGNNPKIIADKGSELILKQIFQYGFFHADPHPGNIFILNNNVICFLDYGMMGILHPKYKNYIGNLIIGYVNNDAEKITKTILSITDNQEFKNVNDLENDIYEMMEEYSILTFKEINMGELLNKTIKIIFTYKLKIPPNIYLLAKALITIEGVGRKLDPDFNMFEHIKPYAKKILRERSNPLKLTKELYSSIIDFSFLLRDLPSEIKEIIRQLKGGKIKIEFEHKGLEPALKKSDQISNRISFSIVLASLIIGSSLIVLSDIPPLYNDIPIIGIIGFITSALLGFWLLISILRHNRM